MVNYIQNLIENWKANNGIIIHPNQIGNQQQIQTDPNFNWNAAYQNFLQQQNQPQQFVVPQPGQFVLPNNFGQNQPMFNQNPTIQFNPPAYVRPFVNANQIQQQQIQNQIPQQMQNPNFDWNAAYQNFLQQQQNQQFVVPQPGQFVLPNNFGQNNF